MKRVSLFFAMVGLIAFSACHKDDDKPNVDGNKDTEIPAAQAKTTLNTMSTDMSDDVVSITQSEGVNAIFDLLDLFSDGFFDGGRVISAEEGKSLLREKAKVMTKVMVPQSARKLEDGEGFDFDEAKGIFEWNFETEEFDFTQGGDAVVFKFPTEGSTTNNATFRLTDFQQVEINDGEEIYNNPSVLAADLSVNGDELVTLDLEIDWNSHGDPESAYVSLFVKPYTFVVDFDDTQSTSSMLAASIDKGTTSVASVSVKVDYTSAEKEDVTLLDGYVTYGVVKIDGDIDVTALDASEDGDPNDYINLVLYSQDKKLGDIVFVLEEVEPGLDDYVPYIKYNDGTTQKLEEIIQPVIDEVKSFTADIDDSIGD
jgi:hypothetical protein